MPQTAHGEHHTFELQELSNMGWIQSLFRPRPDYEPLQNGAERDDDSVEDEVEEGTTETAFSWLEYAIFFLLGIAMLWAWYVWRSSIVGEVTNT
jgi:hypothetical protein